MDYEDIEFRILGENAEKGGWFVCLLSGVVTFGEGVCGEEDVSLCVCGAYDRLCVTT